MAATLKGAMVMIDDAPGRLGWPATTFLGRLAPGERHGLFRVGRRTEFRNGSYLLRQRGAGRDVFVVLDGRVDIRMLYPGGREQRIAVRVPGDIIGEMAFVDAKPRSASAAAAGRVSALHLPWKAVNHFFDGNPDAYRQLARTLTDRLRAAETRNLEFKYDVESRVAAALCQLATTHSSGGAGELIVGKTQRELAEMIGAATISVHRALRKFAARHAVRTEHRAIVILDFEVLADVAGARTTMHRLM